MEYKDYGSVLITDLEQNAKILNRFIYKNIDSDEITLTYDKILSLIMEYEAVQRSYIHEEKKSFLLVYPFLPLH